MLRCAALIGLVAGAGAWKRYDTDCEDFFLDGKENACADYISNVDVSLGAGSSCATLFCEVRAGVGLGEGGLGGVG